MPVEIRGVTKVLDELRMRAVKAEGGSVIVGFSTNYAIFVHENLQARHPVGQAKFLEQPFREMRQELFSLIGEAMKKGATMLQGLLIAGLRLQREAQLLTPVDTGLLRNSAFTREGK